MNITVISFAMLALFSASACATVMNGRTGPLGLSSNPSGAQAVIDGKETVLTPASIDLPRDESHTIIFHKEGYEDVSATVVPESSGWIWGNILAGGVIGAAVDYSTGAAKKFSQDTVDVTMVPKPVVYPAAYVATAPASPTQPSAPEKPTVQAASPAQATAPTEKPPIQTAPAQPSVNPNINRNMM